MAKFVTPQKVEVLPEKPDNTTINAFELTVKVTLENSSDTTRAVEWTPDLDGVLIGADAPYSTYIQPFEQKTDKALVTLPPARDTDLYAPGEWVNICVQEKNITDTALNK